MAIFAVAPSDNHLQYRWRGRAVIVLAACCLIAAPPLSARGELLRQVTPPRREAPWPTSTLGDNRGYTISAQENLTELARAAEVGYVALCAANPQIDPWLPPDGAAVIVPGFTIVPPGVGPGITINLPEYRLYFVGESERSCRIHAYPIGIGAEGNDTPLGRFRIRNKLIKPIWQVPRPVQKARHLPRRVPPGPDNPLGNYWLGVSADGIGIHGTNEPYGVGRRSSRGCIRLYPEDIAELFPQVKVGTTVTIIDLPVKLGVRNDALFLEAHPDLFHRGATPLTEILLQIEALDWHGSIDWARVKHALDTTTGLPTAIGYLPTMPR